MCLIFAPVKVSSSLRDPYLDLLMKSSLHTRLVVKEMEVQREIEVCNRCS